MLRNPEAVPYAQASKVRQIDPRAEYRKENPKCKGCPYGDRQHCVGICWKDAYASILSRKRKTVTITETTVIKEVTEE